MDITETIKKLLGADDPTKKFPNNQTYVGGAIIGAMIAVVFLYWQWIVVLGAIAAIWKIRSMRKKEAQHEGQS